MDYDEINQAVLDAVTNEDKNVSAKAYAKLLSEVLYKAVRGTGVCPRPGSRSLPREDHGFGGI